MFIKRTNAKAETPILWPLDAKNWLTGRDPDAGKDWRQEEKETTEIEMVGWHRLNGHESEQTLESWWWTGKPGVLCPWGCRELDMTEHLNWTEFVLCFGFLAIMYVGSQLPDHKTGISCIGRWSTNYQTTREVPSHLICKLMFCLPWNSASWVSCRRMGRTKMDFTGTQAGWQRSVKVGWTRVAATDSWSL